MNMEQLCTTSPEHIRNVWVFFLSLLRRLTPINILMSTGWGTIRTKRDGVLDFMLSEFESFIQVIYHFVMRGFPFAAFHAQSPSPW